MIFVCEMMLFQTCGSSITPGMVADDSIAAAATRVTVSEGGFSQQWYHQQFGSTGK